MEDSKELKLGQYIRMIYRTSPSLYMLTALTIIRSFVYTIFSVSLVNVLLVNYEKGKDIGYLLLICLGFAGIGFVNNVIGFAMNIGYNHSYRNFNHRFRSRIYEKLTEVDYHTYQTSTFLNNYMKLLSNGVGDAWGTQWCVCDIISGIINILTLATVIATMTVHVVVYAILIGIVYIIFSKYIAKLYRLVGEANKQNYRERLYVRRMYYLKEAAFDVRSTPISSLFLKINDDVGTRIVKNVDKYNFPIFSLTTVSESLVRFTYPIAVAYIALITIALDYSSATYMPLIIAGGSILWSIRELAGSIGRFQEIALASKDYFRIIDIVSPFESDGKTEIDAMEIISLDNVTFKYQENEKAALDGITLTIKKGDKIAIVGENGAGKTTFVKLLLRLYDPTIGTITYNNVDYHDFKPATIREKIGAVFQDYQVYSLSVAENVLMREMENEDDEKLVINSLKFAELYDKVEKTQNGIHTMVTTEFDKNGMELSGGERQKLALARIFASKSELLLLDEPSSALDPIAEAKVYEKMMSLANIKTLVFISHRLSTTALADIIYFFVDGKIIEKGTHKELMSIENGRYRKMFETQAKEYVSRGEEVEDL